MIIPNICKNKIDVPNHQPGLLCLIHTNKIVWVDIQDVFAGSPHGNRGFVAYILSFLGSSYGLLGWSWPFFHMGFSSSSWGVPPNSWMVFVNGESPSFEMDDNVWGTPRVPHHICPTPIHSLLKKSTSKNRRLFIHHWGLISLVRDDPFLEAWWTFDDHQPVLTSDRRPWCHGKAENRQNLWWFPESWGYP